MAAKHQGLSLRCTCKAAAAALLLFAVSTICAGVIFNENSDAMPVTDLVCRHLAARWNMPMELATNLACVALYNILICADDSGSMIFEEGGERVNDL